ncbi:hypothetical protein SAMN05216464_110233 [Mucilaginibacter pineti]|uniref:Uncharacterized protein n=1 Tax=Mucilaginibacter pineti TaxID=1391627 RepID=A0A1G7GPA9_9SPHI|nr:hypothetical protein [Mucilaginibacter pineti]SDE89893.1 hypothetical protein SAMN05216464_110233 [Mucilaginibacter pineti]
MDTLMILVIVAIIAAIILVEFNKQQQSKQSSNNIYTNDKQQLYMFTVAEYKISELENHLQTGDLNTAHSNATHELEELTTAYNSGHIQLDELNTRLDNLLNVLDINSGAMAQAC